MFTYQHVYTACIYKVSIHNSISICQHQQVYTQAYTLASKSMYTRNYVYKLAPAYIRQLVYTHLHTSLYITHQTAYTPAFIHASTIMYT